MKWIVYILCILILISCTQPAIEYSIISEPEAETEPITLPDPIIPIDPEQPIIEEPEQEENMILAYLNYDGKLFEYDDKGALIPQLTAGAEHIAKIGKDFWNENNLDIAPLKGGMYEGILMYQGIDGNIYRHESGISSILLFENTRNEKALFPADGDGMVLNYRFIKSDGTIENASFIGVDYGQVYKIEEISGVYHKYIRKQIDGKWDWLKVGASVYLFTLEHGQVNVNGKIIHSMGDILENDNLSEPSYDAGKRKYFGDNGFIQYIQPGVQRRIMTGLGVDNGIAYFFCAMDGKIYKYDIKTDTVTEWISITTGTGNNDKVESYALFEATAAILTSGFIIYWSEGTIWKVDIYDGVKTEIAEATILKAWSE